MFRCRWAALITAILVVNNLRDIDTDRRAGKFTLAVRFGRDGARLEYALLLAAAYLAPALLLVDGSSLWLLLPWATLPLALQLFRTVRVVEGPPLNHTLAGTARLTLLFALAFALGILL